MKPYNKLRQELVRISLSGESNGWYVVRELADKCNIKLPTPETWYTPNNQERAHDLLSVVDYHYKQSRNRMWTHYVLPVLAATFVVPVIYGIAVALYYIVHNTFCAVGICGLQADFVSYVTACSFVFGTVAVGIHTTVTHYSE